MLGLGACGVAEGLLVCVRLGNKSQGGIADIDIPWDGVGWLPRIPISSAYAMASHVIDVARVIARLRRAVRAHPSRTDFDDRTFESACQVRTVRSTKNPVQVM